MLKIKVRPDWVRKDGTLWMTGYKDERHELRILFNNNHLHNYYTRVVKNQSHRFWTFWRDEYLLTNDLWEGCDFWLEEGTERF